MTTPFQSAMAKLAAVEKTIWCDGCARFVDPDPVCTDENLCPDPPLPLTPSEAAAIRERLEWRPPETAPKDGTEILAMVPVTPGLGDTDATPLADRRVIWWEARGQWTDDRDCGPVTFTAWQPLPPPPAKELT